MSQENLIEYAETNNNEIAQIPGAPIIAYSTTSQSIRKLRQRFAHLIKLEKIEGDKKSSSYIAIRIAVAELIGLRSILEIERKEQKKISLDHGRRVDRRAGEIEESIRSMETPLKDLKKKVDDEEARVKQAKIEAEEKRIKDIRTKIDQIIYFRNNVGITTADKFKEFITEIKEKQRNLSDEIYQEFTTEMKTELATTLEILDAKLVKREKLDEEEKERRVEADRLVKQKDEQDAAQKKLDDERKKFEQQQREVATKEEAKKREEGVQEREKIAAEKAKRDELNRINQEQEKKEANERLKCETEKKRVAMLPDKEKLHKFYYHLHDLWNDLNPMKSLRDDEAKNLLRETAQIYSNNIADFLKRSDNL